MSATSEPFIVLGEIDLEPLVRAMRRKIVEALHRSTEFPESWINWLSGQRETLARYLEPGGTPARRGNALCITLVVGGPYVGEVEACAPASAASETGLDFTANDISIRADVAWRDEDIIPFPAAAARAEEIAKTPYLAHVEAMLAAPAADSLTWRSNRESPWDFIDIKVDGWVYFDDVDYWIFRLRVTNVSLSKYDGRNVGIFGDLLTIRIDASLPGSGCILDTSSLGMSYAVHDFRELDLSCR